MTLKQEKHQWRLLTQTSNTAWSSSRAIAMIDCNSRTAVAVASFLFGEPVLLFARRFSLLIDSSLLMLFKMSLSKILVEQASYWSIV